MNLSTVVMIFGKVPAEHISVSMIIGLIYT